MIKLKPSKYMSATQVTKKPPRSHQQTPTIGQTATKAFFEVKQFLQKEIPLPATFLEAIRPAKPAKTKKELAADDIKERTAQLKKAVARSHEVLASARSIFPFALFPDDVVVDRTKITIIKRDFFWSKNIISIRIEDVLNVSAGTGPFFGSLNISSRVMNSTDHFSIDYFHKKDAIHLKHIIQGYVIAQHNNLDTSHLTKEELIETLCELGDDSNN